MKTNNLPQKLKMELIHLYPETLSITTIQEALLFLQKTLFGEKAKRKIGTSAYVFPAFSKTIAKRVEKAEKGKTLFNKIKTITEGEILLSQGKAIIGKEIFWLNPFLFSRKDFIKKQRANIKKHGHGPFTVTGFENKESGSCYILFFNKHGKEVEVPPFWLSNLV